MRYLATALVVALIATGAVAKPLLFRGGSPHVPGGGGTPATQVCAAGLTGNVCAQFQSGQTFVTWTDMATGAAGDNWRYSRYRSTAPITSGNYGSATLIASLILNNSWQLIGANPNTGGASYSPANRRSAAQPMATQPG
jgi:hypothetical protein